MGNTHKRPPIDGSVRNSTSLYESMVPPGTHLENELKSPVTRTKHNEVRDSVFTKTVNILEINLAVIEKS